MPFREPIDNHCRTVWLSVRDGNAASGSNGDNGLSPMEAPVEGRRGASGTVDESSAEMVELETVATTAYCTLALRKAELRFLSEDTKNAATDFMWLASLAQAGKPGVPIPPRAYELAQCFGTNVNDGLGHIGERAEALREQIRLGLDYFGQPPKYAPLLHHTYYLAQAEILFNHADAMEKLVSKKDEMRSNDATLRRSILKLISASEQEIERLRGEAAPLIEEIALLNITIPKLIERYEKQETAVLNANTAFRDAVERESEGCNFLEVVTCIGTLVATTATVYGAIAGAATAIGHASKMARSTPRSWANDKLIAKQLLDGGKSLRELRPAWNQLKESWPADRPEVGKLVMLQADVDKMTAPYLSLAETHQLRQEVTELLELAQHKNGKILAYTQLAAVLDELNTMIQFHRSEIDRFSVDLSLANHRLNFETAYTSLARYAFETRAVLIRLLYQAQLSFNYWSLSNTKFRIPSDSLEAIREIRVLMADSVVKAFENLRPPRGVFSNQPIFFTAEADPYLIREFINTGYLRIRLTPLMVARWGIRMVYVQNVVVKVTGVSTSDNILKAKLTQEGTSGISSTGGVVYEFIHRRMSTSHIYNIETDIVISPGSFIDPNEPGIYWGLGAIGDWSLSVLGADLDELGDNLGLDRSGVTRIDLIFAGRCASPD